MRSISAIDLPGGEHGGELGGDRDGDNVGAVDEVSGGLADDGELLHGGLKVAHHGVVVVCEARIVSAMAMQQSSS